MIRRCNGFSALLVPRPGYSPQPKGLAPGQSFSLSLDLTKLAGWKPMQGAVQIRGVYEAKNEFKGKPNWPQLQTLWEGRLVTEPVKVTFTGKAETASTAQPVDEKAVTDLIRQLGDNDWKVREAATAKLIEMGKAVNPLLKAKAEEKNIDPEVAARIQVALEKTGGLPQTVVTDEATGITVSLENNRTALMARQERLVLWMTKLGGEGATSLKIENGKVILLPGNTAVDLATGKMLGQRGGR